MNDSNDTSISSSNTTVSAITRADVEFSLSFQFWFLLSCEIVSLPCYVFVILYLLFKKNQRQAIHNHAILVLLIMSFFIVLFDYSWIVDSNLRGEVWLASPAFCQIWLLIDFGFYSASRIVLA